MNSTDSMECIAIILSDLIEKYGKEVLDQIDALEGEKNA